MRTPMMLLLYRTRGDATHERWQHSVLPRQPGVLFGTYELSAALAGTGRWVGRVLCSRAQPQH